MPSRFPLRPYQREAIAAVIAARKAGLRRMVISLPTGAGKTVIFSHLAALASRPVLVLAHREELLQQAKDKLQAMLGEGRRVDIEQATLRAQEGAAAVVASIRSLRSDRLAELRQKFAFGLVIYDECHHAPAEDNQRVLRELGVFDRDWDGTLLGFTATTMRGDGMGLDAVFQDIVYARTLPEMILDGYLCPLRGFRIATHADITQVGPSGEDLDPEALEQAINIEERNALVARAIQELARDRRTIAFCVTVAHARNLAKALSLVGVPAGVVYGEMRPEDRARTLERFRAGELQAITNVAVLTEGFDDPGVSCIAMARPTRSVGLYAQCLDEASEILTPAGFKGIDNMQPDDQVAGFDPQTGQIRWVPVLSLTRRPLAPDEAMYALTSPSVDLRVTGGHRMVYRGQQKRADAPRPWQITTAAALAQRRSGYEVPAAGLQDAPGVPLSDDELRFLGWFLSDGCWNRGNNQIQISQAEHQPYHDAIERCLRGCGFKYGVHRSWPRTQFRATSRRVVYTISRGTPRGQDKHLRGWGALSHYINKDLSTLLEDLTPRQLGVLLEAIHLGDGAKQVNESWTRRTYHITTANRIFGDRLQSLCLRRGYRCNLVPRKTPTGNPAWILHIKPETDRVVGGAGSGDRPHLAPSPTRPGERVWCVENELGTIVVRRNGKAAIVGNCAGRGTRLHPGKSDCLILDFADVSAMSLVTLPSLMGFPREMDLEGQDVAEALRFFESLAFDYPGFEVEAGELSLANIQQRAELFDPLTLDVDPEVAAVTPNAWWSLGSAGLALYFMRRRDELSEFLILRQDEGKVRYTVQLDRVKVATFSTLQEAVTATDYEIEKMGRRAAESAHERARWRHEPITDGLRRQLAALKPPRRADTVAEAMRYLVYARWSRKRRWGPPRPPERR